MPVLSCEHCGGEYQLADSDIGSVVTCPHCQKQTTSRLPPGAGGVAEMARVFTERVSTQNELQKVPFFAWLGPIAALVATAICHLILVLIYLHVRPVPHIIVFWLPVVLGVLAGYGLFAGITRSQFIGCPKWGAPLVTLLSLGLSAILPFVAQQKYALKVRVSLTQQVGAFVAPPYLPRNTATCTTVGDPESSPAGGYTFLATLKSGGEYLLATDVKLFEAMMRYDSLVKDMQLELAESVIEKPLEKCLSSYPHLESLTIQESKITATPSAGVYIGHIKFDNSLQVDFSGKAEKDSMALELEVDSHLRALAIPLASELWQQFDPGTDSTCLDVKLGKPTKEDVRLCEAVMTSGDSIPVVIDENPEGGSGEIDVFFQFREAAIVEINAELEELADLRGDGTPARCVHVDKKEQLRDGEFSLRAVFPEGDPVMVLARQDGHEVSIVAEEHSLLLAPSSRSVEKSWSMVIPSHYERKDSTEFVRTLLSSPDKLQLSLETKPVSTHAKFNLREYAMNEREKWGQSRPTIELGDVTPVETRSGLTGYGYSVVRGTALRVKYFFMKDGNLAVVTAISTEATAGLEGKVVAMLESLRFKDVTDEGAGS